MMDIAFIDLKTQQSRIREKVEAGWKQILEHGAYIMGPEISALETRLAEWAGSQQVISCSSGTDALVLALMGLEIKPGEGVIVPSFTFAASAEVMPTMGAIPIFAEVEEDSFNLDPTKLDDALAAGYAAGVKIVGIIGVGLFGQPANYTAIRAFADTHGLWLIDDAAQSFGARLDGRPVGQLADITCTSFFPAKPLGAYGDGGAVFTDDDRLAAVVRSCRIHGMGQNKYENVRIGMTGRLDSLQAVVLDAKLDIFADELIARQTVADRYANLLDDLVSCPQLAAGATSSWAQYVIKLPSGTDRNELQQTLAQHNVPTAIYYPIPMHRQLPYQSFPVSQCGLGVTMDLCDKVLALPMHPYLKADQQSYIASRLKDAVVGDNSALSNVG